MSSNFTTKFAIPEVIFGNGAIKHLASCARGLGARRILLVSDMGVEDAGWVQMVMDLLAQDSLECVYFNEIDSNPRDSQVHAGVEVYLAEGCDVIVALGGGSPIDTGKGIGIIAGNGGNIADYEGANRIMRPLPPMISAPTTAGSGSDMTQYSIITDVSRKVKMSIISRSLVPNISIIDPTMLRTKTQELIIASAVDALAHAVESYVSRLASPFTDHHALQAIRLFVENLERAVEHRDPKALEQLSIASTAAGMSFSNAGLGALHSLAHSLGGMFDVLHGLVHPIMLPAVMRFNLPECIEKMAAIGRITTGRDHKNDVSAAYAGIEHLERLFQTLNVPTHLREILPDPEVLEPICRMAVYDACTMTNPRDVTCEDLQSICKEAW
ncbi:iron-containing alcohol dehydrogenase [Oceanidesulfovibrio marinus]|uniref:Iron-containing alcohol dehydrogenase n=1 Tax=Oceanidesulfovibrio marinus TaxID=370038 RepID=A0ABX6NHB5_9BACT|nr:iron-containing alcohol dehydrogenase [Oceanidesulfovibrio marinus]QJT09611.1 iron-containing alcohol dehydrogenase [Oceanidesulfovibrio marinus]